MKDQPHKIFWDHEKTRYHMNTTGLFASHVDAQLGVGFDDLEGLSIREQREIITFKAQEMHRTKRLKNRF